MTYPLMINLHDTVRLFLLVEMWRRIFGIISILKTEEIKTQTTFMSGKRLIHEELVDHYIKAIKDKDAMSKVNSPNTGII